MYRYPLIFGVVVLLLIVGVFTIFGGHKSPKPTVSQSQIQPLPNYSTTDAQVIMTVDGVVDGDDAHRAIRITVGQNERDLDVIQGYSGTVISHQQFYNTSDAYNVFLRSIAYNGFVLPLKKQTVPVDERGQCPNGFRYIFELKQNGKDLSRLWGSTCSPSIGTLGGNSQLLQNLFQNQITNYELLVENVSLGF